MQVLIDGVNYAPRVDVVPGDKPLPELLREFRGRSGYTLDEACEQIGITKSRLWELENGPCNMRLGTAIKIAETYNVSLATLAHAFRKAIP